MKRYFRENAVMNAACSVAKSKEEISSLIESKADVVVLGSITLDKRSANPGSNWYAADYYALNSFGMPNYGKEGYKELLPELVKEAHDAGKIFMLNIAGFSVDEYKDLAVFGEQSGVDVIEANFGCPNTEHGSIVSFDIELMESSIRAILENTTDVGLVVKVSPYSDPNLLKSVADMFSRVHEEHPRFFGVTTMNTLPNAYMSEGGQHVIGDVDSKGLAGMSGRAVQPFALGQVVQFRENLPETMSVIGVGGIETRQDAELFFEVGASAVQAATLIVRDGHEAINRLIA